MCFPLSPPFLYLAGLAFHYGPGWSPTLSLPASASWVLGLHVFVTKLQSGKFFTQSVSKDFFLSSLQAKGSWTRLYQKCLLVLFFHVGQIQNYRISMSCLNLTGIQEIVIFLHHSNQILFLRNSWVLVTCQEPLKHAAFWQPQASFGIPMNCLTMSPFLFCISFLQTSYENSSPYTLSHTLDQTQVLHQW